MPAIFLRYYYHYVKRKLLCPGFCLKLSPVFLEPPQFFLAGNPLICNCNLQWFHQVATVQLQNPGLPAQSLTSMNQLYPEIPDFEHVTCRVLNTSDPSKHYLQSFTQLDEEEFLCPYETHCLALCLCCDFLACDCQVNVMKKFLRITFIMLHFFR